MKAERAEERTWILIVLLGLALFCLSRPARPQTVPANIVRPWDGITARATWPSSTTRLACETPGIAAGPVGALDVQPGEPPESVEFPLSFPVLEVRCRACNTAGCSELSPNAIELRERLRADCNGNGVVTVSDIVCVGQVIFAGG